MADKSETQTLLRQIKYLTDLINSAKEKEKAKQCRISASFHKKAAVGPATFSSVPSQSGFSSHINPSNSVLSCTHHSTELKEKSRTVCKGQIASLHKHIQVSASLTERGADSRGTIQTVNHLNNQYVTAVVQHRKPAGHQTVTKSDSKDKPKSANVLVKGMCKTSHLQADSKPQVGQASINPQAHQHQNKCQETRSKADQLTKKRAEVSQARELMASKIEDLKACLDQLSAAKKLSRTSKKTFHDPDELSRQLREQSLSCSEVKTSGLVDQNVHMIRKDSLQQKNETTSIVAKEAGNVAIKCTQPVLVQSKSCPCGAETISLAPRHGSTHKQPDNNTQRSGLGSSSGSVELLVPKEALQKKVTTANSDGKLSKSSMEIGKESKVGFKGNSKEQSSSKADTVAQLQKELAETEKKLSYMRQKMGCMLKDSPTKIPLNKAVHHADGIISKAGPSRLTNLTMLGTEVHKNLPVKNNHDRSLSVLSPKRPFPNRRSLKWTLQKCSAPSQETLVVSSTPSLRSFGKGLAVTKSAKPVHSHLCVGDAQKHLLTSASGTKVSSLKKLQPKAGTAVEPSSSSAATKVKTTRCLFGKYILRNVKTGSVTVKTGSVTPQKAAVTVKKSRFQLVRSPKHVSQPPENADTQSAVQRAARVVLSKYKMQRVLTSGPLYKTYNPYHRQQSSQKTHAFARSSYSQYTNYHQRGWKKAWLGQYPYQAGGSSRRTYWRERFGWGINPRGQHTIGHYPHSALQAKKALKAAMLQQRSQYYHYRRRQTHSASFELVQRRLKVIRKHKLVKQGTTGPQSASPTKSAQGRQERILLINGILYRSSGTRLTKASKMPSKSITAQQSAVVIKSVSRKRMHTVTVRGVRFRVDSKGTKLQRVDCAKSTQEKATVSRVDIGGTTYIQTREGTLEKVFDNQTKTIINRVKQRSIAAAAAKFKKDNTKGKKKLCLYYSRFGKCSRGDKCPYTHDPDKIAVCTRFLRGTCKVDQCPFSHKVVKEKMPVCAFFLRGVCAREDCPYLHVKVDHGAEICQDFVNGFCSLADKCKKLHTLTCPAFAKNGFCPDGKKCRLQHKRENKLKSAQSQQAQASSSSSEPKASRHTLKRKHSTEAPADSQEAAATESDGSLPRKLPRLPAFISLADYSTDESPVQTPSRPAKGKSGLSSTGSSLQIKPRI